MTVLILSNVSKRKTRKPLWFNSTNDGSKQNRKNKRWWLFVSVNFKYINLGLEFIKGLYVVLSAPDSKSVNLTQSQNAYLLQYKPCTSSA